MASVVVFSLQLALSIAVPFWIIRRDTHGLGTEELDRAWNDASFWSAIVGFNVLAIFVHFLKTRRSLRGFLLGLIWTVGASIAIGVASQCASWLLNAGA